jgi:hypothetical protein
VVSGALGRHITSHAQRCVRTALIELGDAAAEAGLNVLLQPESRALCRPWSIFGNWEAALELVAECRHPHVKLAVDLDRLLPGNMPQPRLNEIVPFLGQVQIPHAEPLPHFGSRILRPPVGSPPLTARDGLSAQSSAGASRTAASTLATAPSDCVLALQLAGFSEYVELEFWSETIWQSAYESWLPALSQRWNVKPICAN